MTTTYFGDFSEDDTVRIPWSTNAAAGEAATITSVTVKVYKDGGTTEVTAPTGITNAIDFDGIVGSHLTTIDFSANVFYSTGSDFMAVLSAGTVDGKAVAKPLGLASIENRHNPGFTSTDRTTLGERSTQTSVDTIGTDVDAVQAKTDQLNFTGTDVKATLDGETVTPGAGTITSTVIATDAIGSDEFAASAVTKVQAGLATSTSLDNVSDDVADVKTTTDKFRFTVNDVKATLDGETVTVGTSNDKTGYKLAADGLDTLSAADPGGVATTIRTMIIATWRHMFEKADIDSNTGLKKTYGDDGTTVNTSQTLTDVGGVETQGKAT